MVIAMHHGVVCGAVSVVAILAIELRVYLLQVIHIKMRITQSMNEISRCQPDHLRYHEGQQRVGSDIEWHAKKQIGASLIELAGQATVGNVKLE